MRFNGIVQLGILTGTLCLVAAPAVAQQPAPQPAPAAAAAVWVPLWPQGAPGALGTEQPDIPDVEVFLPAKNLARSAVVVLPGGGYTHLALPKEGEMVAQWLKDHGVAGIVLRYRLGPRYHYPIQLQDAQRAVRYVRAHAAEFGVDKNKVGVWGFSAGGHLSVTIGTHYDAGNAAAADPIDRESCRPDFMVLSYTPVEMEKPYATGTGARTLLGDTPDPAQVADVADDKHVTSDTPPAFIYHTTDDGSVPVINALLIYETLVKNGVSAELHIYQHGPHGTGLAQGYPELRGWPDQLMHWMVANGWAQGS
jgi:acetyl esterase/lipase